MSDNAPKTKGTPKRKELTEEQQLELMDKLKTDLLFKNHKGEYFASENLANLSITAADKKEGKKVEKISREIIGKTDKAK